MPGSCKNFFFKLLEAKGLKNDKDFIITYNPHFIAQGTTIYNLENPDFVLIGTDSNNGHQLVKYYNKIYKQKIKILLLNTIEAEITKISINSFITTKITFSNFISEVFENTKDVNASKVLDTIGKDHRIGNSYLGVGTKYSGPCFPRDNKALNYFIRVREESSVTLKNITFDGDNDTQVKYAVVSPDKEEGKLYNLFIDNCKFKNFKNKQGGSIFKAYEGTLADTISIKNSYFEDSYRGLNLSYEKNNIGKYNANVILIHNSVFENIQEHAINYTKSGYLTNIGKGKLIITNSIFSKVANFEKGIAVRTKNIPKVLVKNSVFQNSYNILKPINIGGSDSRIENCLLSTNGSIKNSKGVIQKNIFYKSPKWKDKKNYIPSKKSILLKENNKVNTIGLIEPLTN